MLVSSALAMEANPPTIITIFGITGDLSRTKLIPALLRLERACVLGENTRIIGFSRRAFSPNDFRGFLREAFSAEIERFDADVVERLINRISYCPALFDDAHAYATLGERILDMERHEFAECANKLYYLAVAPEFYHTIFLQLANSGLTIPCAGEHRWARVLVEKPFGRDSATAEELDLLLGKLFKEEQIFRIDHYLAKEAVQNIISFRFANALFEPVWNSRHIDRITVRLLEEKDIGSRGTFFESVGALRDVGQNHLLQMLSLIAMEHPGEPSAANIRRERARVFEKLQLAHGTLEEVARHGQYRGYRDVSSVATDSNTETYFRLEAEINNTRWRGARIVLESGKALNTTLAEITLEFKSPELCIASGRRCHHNNSVTFRIGFDEGISITFWVKKPGLGNELEARELSFSYRNEGEHESERLFDAYERLLADALSGDQTLFASTEEVRASWKFITPILHKWRNVPPQEYEKGSGGPAR
jgi:glucose-6-phosphate 1-dehydrogenase